MTSRTAPVQTLGRGTIERSGAAGLNEVLRTFAGVSVRDYGGIGGLKTVSVRNLGAQHTAVSYDGTVVSDAQTGQVDISRFGLEDLSEVSVETGASDDIFRSARLLGAAGILNLKTIQATDRISARIRYASFNTWNPGLSLSRALGQGWSAGASTEWLSSDGDYPFTLANGNYSTRERRLGGDVKTLRAEANISGSAGSSGRLHIKARYYRSDRGLPGPVIYYIQDPTERLGNSDASLSADYNLEKLLALGRAQGARVLCAFQNQDQVEAMFAGRPSMQSDANNVLSQFSSVMAFHPNSSRDVEVARDRLGKTDMIVTTFGLSRYESPHAAHVQDCPVTPRQLMALKAGEAYVRLRDYAPAKVYFEKEQCDGK